MRNDPVRGVTRVKRQTPLLRGYQHPLRVYEELITAAGAG
jgi:hypothetical protein